VLEMGVCDCAQRRARGLRGGGVRRAHARAFSRPPLAPARPSAASSGSEDARLCSSSCSCGELVARGGRSRAVVESRAGDPRFLL